MGEMCGDNRFELIEKYIKELLEHTNIETSETEMLVIESILFRFWQMGWLEKLEEFDRQKAEIERLKGDCNRWELLYKLALREKEVAYEGCRNMLKRAKSEAIKEFWEKLKAQNTMDRRIISVQSGDNLVEEMG